MSGAMFDATGEPVNDAAHAEVAAKQLAAAQREAEQSMPDPDDPPPGSWRAEFADFEPEFAVIVFDGEEWEVPAEMPLDFFNAQQAGDVGAMIQAIVGPAGMARLRIPRDFPTDRLLPMLNELTGAAGKVWGTGNFNRSARRSQSTRKR